MSDKPVILIVDDSMSIRKAAIGWLGDGYQVEEAKNGFSALAAVHDYKPDLILMDILMPEMNGYDSFLAIKNNPSFEDVPIVFLSGKDTPFDKAYGMQIGCNDYLVKPFTEKTLLDVVRKYVK